MHVMGSVSPANEREGFLEEGVAVSLPVSQTLPASPSRFDEGDGMRSPAPPPPPPPPPLPPPPPPPLPPPPPPLPLPLFPGLGDPAGGLRKMKRVRSFFWKTIPEEKVKGRANLWTRGRVEQHYQIDVETIEELFGQTNPGIPSTRGGKARSSFRETKEEVSILDSKRGMNIGIFLKQFRRSNEAIVDDVRRGNSEPYGAEPLRELLKMLPEQEEVKKLKSYRGDVSKLSLADSFMYLLIQLPSYSVRIESMLLKEEFPAACKVMKRDIRILLAATKELMTCEELHAVLHLVLQAGNILNAGGYAGNAVGFKLSSLLSLADTKANKPGMNLLHFVALEAQKKDEKLLEFPVKLNHIQAAARISLETLDSELQWLTSRTRSLEESVQRDTELLQQLDGFLQSATSSLCCVRLSRQQLRKEGSELVDFFCEDRDTFRLDDCFSIFNTFCSRFTTAVKENTEREQKEAARCRRLRELEEQKRHSWAGGERVGRAFGLRCNSETDMDAAVSRSDEAGLLLELLSPRPRSRSPLPHSPMGRSGSLRRSRVSPSGSPSIAAERELSSLLGMATLDPPQRGGGGEVWKTSPSTLPEPALRSPGLSPLTRLQSQGFTMHGVHQNQQPGLDRPAPQTRFFFPETSGRPQNKDRDPHHTTTTYLRCDTMHRQTRVDIIDPISNVTGKPTSDLNQQLTQSDHNNNGYDHLPFGTPPDPPTDFENAEKSKADQDLLGKITCSDDTSKPSSTSTGEMSVVLEKCTLVPELKAFEKVTSHNEEHRHGDLHHNSNRHGCRQDDIVITDVEEEGADKPNLRAAQNPFKVGNAEKSAAQTSETNSSSQGEEEEGQKQKVIVWCVTGVCEAAGELALANNTRAQMEEDQCRFDNHEGSERASSFPANRMPSETRPANEKPVPVPISSQPVPVSRCDDPPLPASFTSRSPADRPALANESPALTTDASDDAKESANQERDAEDSTNEKRELADDKSRDEIGRSHHANNEKTRQKREPSTSSKPSPKTRPTGIKPATPNAPAASKPKPVRTLTSSENQSMRRVVPISRPSRGAPSQGKHPERPPGHHRSSSNIAAPASLSVANPNSASLRRGEKSATAPSSRRSSFQKNQDSKDPKDPKVSGIQGSAREQIQDLQRKLSIRKPAAKPKPQPEEKMCRSTLRALAQAGMVEGRSPGGGGGGGSVSAPATPMHKSTTSASSSLPGFARNTASSSFRLTHTTLAPPAHSPHSSRGGSDTSPKTSPKASLSVSSLLTRTGSLRVTATSKSSDHLNPPSSSSSSSPLRRTPSIRAPPGSPLHNSPASPKGHTQNDSSNLSDKSAQSRDSVKLTRPNWR